jgi:AraC-like DNA-binding protein
VTRRTTIKDLAFRHNTKPALGLEVLRLADLFARERAGELPELLTAPQRPQFDMILIGLTGKGSMTIDFTPVPLGAGVVTVFARGRVQQFAAAPKTLDAWMIVFSSEFLAMTPPPRVLAPDWAKPAIAPSAGDLREVLELSAQLAAEHARPLDAVQPALLGSLLRALILRLERYVPASVLAPSELQRFFTILERDCLTTREVAHYAKASGLSPRRLGELLLAHTGRSTKQVIDERVVLEHKRLLAHTEISVKQLAERTGFAEPTNLVKFFRHHTGMTPLAFRTNLPSGRRS